MLVLMITLLQKEKKYDLLRKTLLEERGLYWFFGTTKPKPFYSWYKEHTEKWDFFIAWSSCFIQFWLH